MIDNSDTRWPVKHNLFGVYVSEIMYEDAMRLIIRAAQKRTPAIVDHMPVHGLIEASRDPDFNFMINSFNVVAPDGQPLHWALNHLPKTKLSDRIYGLALMLKLCQRSSEVGVSIY